jgi:hypothetical protein
MSEPHIELTHSVLSETNSRSGYVTHLSHLSHPQSHVTDPGAGHQIYSLIIYIYIIYATTRCYLSCNTELLLQLRVYTVVNSPLLYSVITCSRFAGCMSVDTRSPFITLSTRHNNISNETKQQRLAKSPKTLSSSKSL